MRARILFAGLAAAGFACSTILAGLSSPVSAAAGTGARSGPDYYVSLGDSYAAGYQPTSAKGGHTSTNGFAYQVVRLAKAKGYHFTLVNFGCGGATTTSILQVKGCSQLGPGAPAYPQSTQAAAAEQFLRSHRAKIGLITVSIGGNDVTSCAAAANPIICVAQATQAIKKNLTTLLSGVRQAAGDQVRVVGTTYPDVILGLALSTQPALKNLANLSVTAFKSLINPTLKTTYTSAGADFADVTAATGAYGPMTDMVTLPPYGTIPVPVAKVCQLTYFCAYHDIHPKTAGYAIIAGLVVDTLPRAR